MCGIIGFWDNSTLQNRREILIEMANVISHRGPDDVGYYENNKGVAFAHRRLSILDLSVAGHQPMESDDKDLVIVFNGEIYNYKEITEDLKAKGIQFKTHTDTEVILYAYKVYGIECLKYFNGMFAFTIWDNKKNIIFAARDRVGIKPFYYYYGNKRFVFGSEIKALLRFPVIKKEPNYNAIINYNVISHQLNHETWFKNVFLLEPGHYLIICKDSLTKEKYWSPYVNINYERNYNTTVNELRDLIHDSIKIHQISDVEVGAHLSGGVDSSTIVAIASKTKDNLHTFSSGFTGLSLKYDESKEISIVKNKFSTNHHEITTNGEDVKTFLPTMCNALDEPEAGPATIPMFFVNKLISENGIKVVNGGQGVDELFGGYPPFFILAFKNLMSFTKNGVSFPPSELAYMPKYFQKYFKSRDLFKKKGPTIELWNNPKDKSGCIDSYQEVANSLQSGIFSFEKVMLMSLKYYLPALLHVEDRMSMIWSIESRVPFLDYRLVEYALTIPSYYKVKKGVSKAVFRDAVRGLVPNEVLDNKIKRGYPTPICEWSRNELSSYFIEILEAKELYIDNLFNKKSISIMLNDHMTGKQDYSSALWSMLCTELWFRANFN
jgi:asparagine synthase (glutamine-hydrolysing)